MIRTLRSVAADLEAGRTSSRALVSECLDRIAAPEGEGARTFLKVHAAQALATADFIDQSRQRGSPPGPFAGIPVSVKDLFDIAGDVTTAGSTVLRTAAPAAADAPVIHRLKAAGFIVLGRTNMTEFAYSGLGLNPHYGTPLNPWDRRTRRVPGGSSSGAGVCIADRMCFGALGTDTGGSCRIPAALCGVVGFKPTAARVPREGAYPLSVSLDSVGPLAASVDCCAILDAVISGDTQLRTFRGAESQSNAAAGLNLAVLTNYATDGLDTEVAAAFKRSLTRLSAAGARLTDLAIEELAALADINQKGGLPAAEAFAHHRSLLATHSAQYDPRVSSRIRRGSEQDAADYIEVHRRRAQFIERVGRLIRPFDAVLMPTVPVVAPAIAAVAADQDYVRLNALVLRNPSLVNFLDGCAISIPVHEPGGAPVGLSVFAAGNADQQVLAAAARIEHSLQ